MPPFRYACARCVVISVVCDFVTGVFRDFVLSGIVLSSVRVYVVPLFSCLVISLSSVSLCS